MIISGTYSLQWLDDSSSPDSKRPKQTPNSQSGATSLNLAQTPSSVTWELSFAQMPLQTAGKIFRKLVLFSGVGQQINKNKQTSRSRKMGGGTSPTCSVKHKLTLTRLLKLAASCERLVNKNSALSDCRVLIFTRPSYPINPAWFQPSLFRRKKNYPQQKLILKADSTLQLGY